MIRNYRDELPKWPNLKSASNSGLPGSVFRHGLLEPLFACDALIEGVETPLA
jgi:hypothetical protein